MHSFSYLEPVCCSMSSAICCFLTYIQASQEAGQVVWYSYLLKNFPQLIVIHTVNKAEIDVFLELCCYFDDPANVGNLISCFSAFSTPKYTTGHCTALQRDKIQLHQAEHRHKLPQPGKPHGTLTQQHPRGQTPQPRTITLRTILFSFFSYKSHWFSPLYISTWTLAFCDAVKFSSVLFLLKIFSF